MVLPAPESPVSQTVNPGSGCGRVTVGEYSRGSAILFRMKRAVVRRADPYRDTEVIDERAPRVNQAVVGIVATLWAQLAMGNSWRIGVDDSERTDLVTGGVFSVVRNPIFTTMSVTALGLALLVPNVVALIGLAVLVFALELQVRVVEEPYLRSVHGQTFVRYASRVGRFLPGVGRTTA